MSAIPAITLWQPWASLIAEGVKTIETRSWPAPAALIGDTIAIHAAAKRPRDEWGDEPPSPWTDLYAMAKHYDEIEDINNPGQFCYRWTGPLGAVVATARLADCVPMIDADATVPEPWMPHLAPNRGKPGWSHWQGPNVHVVVENTGRNPWIIRDVTDQLPYGDFAPGRWAWMLTAVERLDEPIPAKGRQRVWEWTR